MPLALMVLIAGGVVLPRGDGSESAPDHLIAVAPHYAPEGPGDGAAPPPAVPPANPPEITADARQAIERGMKFLVSRQSADGSWRTQGSTGDYPTAMTALCGLALLAGGNTPTEGVYARNVSRAVTFLISTARRDGLIAQPEEESHNMHGHGFAMLFLAQCYGMEEDLQRRAQIRLVLQRAVELTARSQSAAGGWLYTPDANDDEGSVTVTQMQGLRACRNAGIAVPKRVIDNAMAYLDHSSNPDGGIRYQVSDRGPSRPAITAAAVVCWYNAGVYDQARVNAALDFLKPRLGARRSDSSNQFGHYFYGHLYLAQAMYLRAGMGAAPAGAKATAPAPASAAQREWEEYFAEMREALVRGQQPDGSWEGDMVGPIYGTSVALVILQLPYKNLPIMQR